MNINDLSLTAFMAYSCCC